MSNPQVVTIPIAELTALYTQRAFAELEPHARALTLIDPSCGSAWKYLGIAQTRLGFDGLSALENAARLLPDDFDAHLFHGYALTASGNPYAALDCFAVARQLVPDNLELDRYTGQALEQLGRWVEAEPYYRRVVAGDPSNADAWLILGATLSRIGQWTEAMDCFRRSLGLSPSNAAAWVNLGYNQSLMGWHIDATASYFEAQRQSPEYAPAYHHLAIAQQKLGQMDAARQNYKRAAELDQKGTEDLYQLSCLYVDELLMVDALEAANLALARDSQRTELHLMKGYALGQLGELDAAVESFSNAMELNSDWPCLANNFLFFANFQSQRSSVDLMGMAERIGLRLAHKTKPDSHWPNEPDPERKIRVGIVSGDLHDHPVGFLLDDILPAINREKYAIYAYSTHSTEDALSRRLKDCVANWYEVDSWSDAQIVEQIRSDQIDILVDLAGHTTGNRLSVFAAKPAPVQTAWLGYFATTGLPMIDYVLLDRSLAPADEVLPYVEKPWYLPHSFLCFSPPKYAIRPSTLPTLSKQVITFGCFNNPVKVNDQVLACWSRILGALTNARLLLKGRIYSDQRTRERMMERCVRAGLDLQRVFFERASGRGEYLQRYHDVDIALDPFPYTGGLTTMESLWMGVPVLTLKGDRTIARQGASLLHTVGLDEWITLDEDEYVAKAIWWAGRKNELAELRNTLRNRLLQSPLCNANQFGSDLASAWRGMWRQWCAQAIVTGIGGSLVR